MSPATKPSFSRIKPYARVLNNSLTSLRLKKKNSPKFKMPKMKKTIATIACQPVRLYNEIFWNIPFMKGNVNGARIGKDIPRISNR